MNKKNWSVKFKFSFLRKAILLFVGIFITSEFLFAQEKTQSVTTITIQNARQTNYKKDDVSGNDTIVLEGNVILTVQKDASTSEITAEKITYDRKTEMLYAEGNVSIVTKDSSSGNDTATADTLLLNTSTLEAVFDGGRIVQTQSDALSLPSGSTLIVFSRIFGRSESNVIAFKNSSLTFCDDPNPHWHIDATRTWLLPGGEFAFFNALLYVGAVPVLYLPAFYYPKDELIFNPVFGSEPRAGTFVQNTFYLKGRKSASDSTASSSSSSASDSTTEAMKSLYNFMKPSVLKEQRREGLMMHNLDEDFKGSTSEYVKIMADWYSNLGYMTGITGNLAPSKDYITSLNFDARLGFSNTVYGSTGSYSPLDANGLTTIDDSQFLGLHMPFRYGGNFSMTLSKPVRVTLTLPIYSDPFFSSDFNTRSESMDWISYLMSLANPSETENTSASTISSYAWQLSASYSPTMPDFMKPYVSSVSMTLNSSVNISALDTNKDVLTDMVNANGYTSEWKEKTPRRMFYYPSQVTPASAKVSLSGTLFEYPKSVKTTSSTSSKVNFVTFNKPDEFKTEKELADEEQKRQKLEQEKLEAEKAALEGEDASKTAATETVTEEPSDASEAEKDVFVYNPNFPVLTGTVPSVSSNAGTSLFSYKLGYTLSPDLVTQVAYSKDNLKTSEDFDWNNLRSYMYTFKSPLSLSSNLSYAKDFITLTDRISYDPIWQAHPYINTDKIGEDESAKDYKDRIQAMGGHTTDEVKSLRRADYTASSQTITGNQSLVIKPFSSVPLLKDSRISHNVNMRLFRYEFTGTDKDEDWEKSWQTAFEKYTLDKIDWDYEDDEKKNNPESYFTSHSVDMSLVSSQLNNKIKETITLSSVLWPLTQKYNGSFSLNLPNTTFSISTAYTPEQNYDVPSDKKASVKEKWDPISQSFSYSLNLFDSPIKFTESLSWDKETGVKKDNDGNITEDNLKWNEKFTSFRLSSSWKFISVSYLMSYTNGAELLKDETGKPKEWKNKTDKEFIPHSFTTTVNPSTKSFFNKTVSFGFNSSLNLDLIKATNNYFTFAPSLSIKAGDVNITFSSTSRNSVLYWYFHEGAGDYAHFGTDVFSGIGNMFWDLMRSYHFSEKSDRKASGYKLKSLAMTMSHDLHDWKFNMSLSISPRLVKNAYSFDPYMTIGVVWNPMASIKTEIVDEYGKWQLNK